MNVGNVPSKLGEQNPLEEVLHRKQPREVDPRLCRRGVVNPWNGHPAVEKPFPKGDVQVSGSHAEASAEAEG